MKCYICYKEYHKSELTSIIGNYGTCKNCKTYEPPRVRKVNAIKAYKLEQGCQKCGYNRCADALQLHHNHKDQKTAVISRMVYQGYSLDRIMQEVYKCTVLCANCHAEHHSQEGY